LDGGVAAPDLTGLALDIRIVTASPDDRTAAMLDAWKQLCPIYLALLQPNAITLTTSASAN
jgi:hypothetical protein